MSLRPIYHIHKRMEGDQKWSNGEIITDPPESFGENLLAYVRQRARGVAQETNVAEVEIRQVMYRFKKSIAIEEEGYKMI